MALLNKTTLFSCLIESFYQSITDNKIGQPLMILHQYRTYSLKQFFLILCTCSPLLIAGEITELYLITARPDHFFQIIHENVELIQKLTEKITTFCHTNQQAFHTDNIVAEKKYFHLILSIVLKNRTSVFETIDKLKSISGITIDSGSGPPGNMLPHFNRFYNPGESEKLRDLLIHYKFISPHTTNNTLNAVFYGIKTDERWQPVIWLKSVAELAYFVDMFFGISDQKNKWKMAHACFRNKNHREFNYNSLRGKQYNYISGKNSQSLQTIDWIRKSLK